MLQKTGRALEGAHCPSCRVCSGLYRARRLGELSRRSHQYTVTVTVTFNDHLAKINISVTVKVTVTICRILNRKGIFVPRSCCKLEDRFRPSDQSHEQKLQHVSRDRGSDCHGHGHGHGVFILATSSKDVKGFRIGC